MCHTHIPEALNLERNKTMTTFNDRIIHEFRSHGGRVDGFGSSLVLLHTKGAKTGNERINPAMSLRDGEDWLVVASAKGAPRDPAWAVNLRANHDIEIEAPVAGTIRTVPVRAVELDGTEYEMAFSRFVDRAPAFSTYQQRAERRLPVIRLIPRPESSAADTEAMEVRSVGSIGPDDLERELSVRRPDIDETLPHYGVVGDNYTILLTGKETNGKYALIDMYVPPDGGPPPHRHDFEEMFHVLEGELEVTFRGRTTVIGAGETVNIPARAPHFFRNASRNDARMLCMISPPGLDEYFTLFGQPLPNRMAVADLTAQEQRQRLAEAVQLGPRYAIENLPRVERPASVA